MKLMDVKKIGYEGLDWIHLAQKGYLWWAVVSTVMNLNSIRDEELLH
jgi:hypothetical protein